MENPILVIGLKGATVMAPRSNRHPFVALRLEASAVSGAAPGEHTMRLMLFGKEKV